MALVTLEDLNGDHYLGHAEGENLVEHNANYILLPYTMNTAEAPLANVNVTVEDFENFVDLNYRYLIAIKDSVDSLKPLNADNIMNICFLRFLAVKHGLVSPKFKPEEYSVNYSEVLPNNFGVIGANIDLPADVTPAMHAKCRNVVLSMIPGEYPANHNFKAAFNKVRVLFTDLVCLVAFVFRVRGHHYTDNLAEIYRNVWEKCRYKTGDLPSTFESIATVAFHAIYPMILDAFWERSVKESLCNGALIKRYDSAAAGTAGPHVIEQGLYDLKLIAPGIEKVLPEAVDELKQIMIKLRVNRWNGSVNARYYKAERHVYNEKRLGAIAATIKAALDQLTDDAPLAKSPALQRIANNAPITGAVLAGTIGGLAKRPETVNALVITEGMENQ